MIIGVSTTLFFSWLCYIKHLFDVGIDFGTYAWLRFATESCGLLGSEYYIGYKDKTQDSDCFGLL